MTDDETNDRDVKRRTYLKGIAAASSAVGIGGAATITASAQTQPDPTADDHVVATDCGEFSPGAQTQQCIACVAAEADCEQEQITPLTPLYTGLNGQVFEPPIIPDDADYVTLKAGLNCYVAPVTDEEGDPYTTFSLPEGSPNVSNATFYRCGGDPEPTVVDVDATCEEITITTANIPDGQGLEVAVTFLNAEGVESTQGYYPTVQDDTATFSLPGEVTPTNVAVTLQEDDAILFDQNVLAVDGPCMAEPPAPPAPDDPRIADLEITCEAITITTTDIPEGSTLYGTVTFIGDLKETYDVAVDDAGVAVIPLSGNFDPANLVISFDGETLYNANIQAVNAPCADVPPELPEPEPPAPPEVPEPPEEPEPPKNKKELKKQMKLYKRRYKQYKRKYEMYKKKLEKTE